MPLNNPLAQAVRTLADFTKQKLIIPSLREQEATAAILEMSRALQREGRIADSHKFSQPVIKREFLGGTVTEPGWAIGHGLVKDSNEPCFAFGRWLSPKIWTNNQLKVSLVFLFAVPEIHVQAFNQLVISLGEFSKSNQLVEQLLKAGDVNEILQVLRHGSPRPDAG